MNVEVKKNGKELTLVPDSRIDAASSELLLLSIREYFTDDFDCLVLDFIKVDFISSNGLRVIVACSKNLGERKIMIINANQAVRDVFNITGLNKFIEVK